MTNIQMYRPAVGDEVTFTGYTEAQVLWGGNDTPDILTIGETYTIEKVDVHASYTKVSLVGVTGRFNSVHFELVA